MTEAASTTSPHGSGRIVDHPTLGALAVRPSVEFTFDGTAVTARQGEPIAAALLAAGFRVFHTMPRTGDARGGYCLIGRCGDCAVIVDGVPNVPACTTPVQVGMAVRTQLGLGDSDHVPAEKMK